LPGPSGSSVQSGRCAWSLGCLLCRVVGSLGGEATGSFPRTSAVDTRLPRRVTHFFFSASGAFARFWTQGSGSRSRAHGGLRGQGVAREERGRRGAGHGARRREGWRHAGPSALIREGRRHAGHGESARRGGGRSCARWQRTPLASADSSPADGRGHRGAVAGDRFARATPAGPVVIRRASSRAWPRRRCR
jgi:hypothetical protein